MTWLRRFAPNSIIPGFGFSFGFTLFYLLTIVLIPLCGLVLYASSLSFHELWEVIKQPRVLSAFRVSFGAAFAAALVNAFFGLIVAWVLVRYKFPFRKLVDSAVDLPFALPTAVAGIALSALYAPTGWLGKNLESLGITVAYTPLGIVVALIFVGLPFIVRTIEPVLQDLDKEVEEASASLGATRFQTFFRVIFPTVYPALLTGFTMAFARGLGEYGSVIFIAGNLPMVSEIVPLIIVIELEQYQYKEATAVAAVMLLASFILLFVINMLQKWSGSSWIK
ncbi:MAG: sulfate ABC transporter permease subunit CysT [Chlamydiales bacterium]|nr:sulfate ABC transporter permease subunit CysT [Chlamydiales bacterium]